MEHEDGLCRCNFCESEANNIIEEDFEDSNDIDEDIEVEE